MSRILLGLVFNASVSRTYGTGDTPIATFGQVIRFREMRRVQLGVRFEF